MTAIARLEDVTKTYREGDAVRDVLDHANATFGASEFVAIGGPSGSGKTTLLNLLAGIDRPTSGSIEVAGARLEHMSERELACLRRDRIGFVFQFFNLIPTLTVLENVLLPAELSGAHRPDTRGLELLDEVGLADRRGTYPDRLSGGEQQRVGIARALIGSPALVLADEPTGNLDVETGGAVMELLDRLTRRAGRSLVLVTHSPAVSCMADRVLDLDHGHLQPRAFQAGTPVVD